MIYYIIRRNKDKEPLALVRINAKDGVDMIIHYPRLSRFGMLAPVERKGQHVYNLIIGNNQEIAEALASSSNYNLEITTQAEWESFGAFELFPVLKLAMAR